MLNRIAKEIVKQIRGGINKKYNKLFLKTCIVAIQDMHEVNVHINIYKRDSEYKASVRKIQDQVRNLKLPPGQELESSYGQLMFEGQMKFKKQNEEN